MKKVTDLLMSVMVTGVILFLVLLFGDPIKDSLMNNVVAGMILGAMALSSAIWIYLKIAVFLKLKKEVKEN